MRVDYAGPSLFRWACPTCGRSGPAMPLDLAARGAFHHDRYVCRGTGEVA